MKKLAEDFIFSFIFRDLREFCQLARFTLAHPMQIPL